jgi:Cys-rich repeat protein
MPGEFNFRRPIRHISALLGRAEASFACTEWLIRHTGHLGVKVLWTVTDMLDNIVRVGPDAEVAAVSGSRDSGVSGKFHPSESNMKSAMVAVACCLAACQPPSPGVDPSVGYTEVIGPFSGHDAVMHPGNLHPEPLLYYGTDLGFSYQHDGNIHFLFGDSWATEAYAPIEASTGSKFDDAFGTIDLSEWPDSSKISSANIPRLLIGRNPGTDEAAAMNPGHAMDLGKTPMHGFSNGKDEFAIFNTTKPQGCATDAQCGNGQSCDAGLGYYGSRFDQEENLTLPCVDGSPGCLADTMVDVDGNAVVNSGFCTDTGSTVWADTPSGRIAAAALAQRIGIRSEVDPREYRDIQVWLTNRFVNVTARTVERFVQEDDDGRTEVDYRTATNAGDTQRVFLWGRPGFISVNAAGRTLGLYFAYADLPKGNDFPWELHYYTGTRDGIPQFSPDEGDATPLDLDSATDGVQQKEVHDLAQQMSVSWVEPLGKWLMFYSGGITKLPSPPLPNCGVLELFTRYECQQVVVGNGAVRMRTADNPWGPWSAPQDVIESGDPEIPGSGQFGPGGVLHHPGCKEESCASHTRTPFYHDDEYGFFYSANIIEEWTRAVDGGVDIYWNASTWDPYRVVLLRTHIEH